jgi:FlaG/FlaF family flagellin (archaellin)
MDFSNRNVQSQTAAPSAQVPAAGSPINHKRSKPDSGKWGRIGVFALVLAVVILLVAVISVTAFGNGKTEDQYVDTTKLQAVFLNTGQVYFGHITTLNSKYFVVTNIYYLQTSGGSSAAGASTANTSVSLVKLGCELHEPYDKMIINSSQVTFWENLQDGGQVAKAVTTFQKQNPNGQKCADQSTSSSSTSNSVQSAGNNSTTPAATPATKP